jgi:hypothetical protein
MIVSRLPTPSLPNLHRFGQGVRIDGNRPIVTLDADSPPTARVA